ncbi:MAG: hypothetical protein OSB42_13995 [Planctomycetota bacterium]|nr:hypothetical protein [Planctomycetota bacterium]
MAKDKCAASYSIAPLPALLGFVLMGVGCGAPAIQVLAERGAGSEFSYDGGFWTPRTAPREKPTAFRGESRPGVPTFHGAGRRLSLVWSEEHLEQPLALLPRACVSVLLGPIGGRVLLLEDDGGLALVDLALRSREQVGGRTGGVPIDQTRYLLFAAAENENATLLTLRGAGLEVQDTSLPIVALTPMRTSHDPRCAAIALLSTPDSPGGRVVSLDSQFQVLSGDLATFSHVQGFEFVTEGGSAWAFCDFSAKVMGFHPRAGGSWEADVHDLPAPYMRGALSHGPVRASTSEGVLFRGPGNWQVRKRRVNRSEAGTSQLEFLVGADNVRWAASAQAESPRGASASLQPPWEWLAGAANQLHSLHTEQDRHSVLVFSEAGHRAMGRVGSLGFSYSFANDTRCVASAALKEGFLVQLPHALILMQRRAGEDLMLGPLGENLDMVATRLGPIDHWALASHGQTLALESSGRIELWSKQESAGERTWLRTESMTFDGPMPIELLRFGTKARDLVAVDTESVIHLLLARKSLHRDHQLMVGSGLSDVLLDDQQGRVYLLGADDGFREVIDVPSARAIWNRRCRASYDNPGYLDLVGSELILWGPGEREYGVLSPGTGQFLADLGFGRALLFYPSAGSASLRAGDRCLQGQRGALAHQEARVRGFSLGARQPSLAWNQEQSLLTFLSPPPALTPLPSGETWRMFIAAQHSKNRRLRTLEIPPFVLAREQDGTGRLTLDARGSMGHEPFTPGQILEILDGGSAPETWVPFQDLVLDPRPAPADSPLLARLKEGPWVSDSFWAFVR